MWIWFSAHNADYFWMILLIELPKLKMYKNNIHIKMKMENSKTKKKS